LNKGRGKKGVKGRHKPEKKSRKTRQEKVVYQ